AVKQWGVVHLFQAINPQQFGPESPHTCRNKNGLGQELRAFGGLDKETAIVLLFNNADFLAKVEGRAKGLDLLEQRVGELFAGAHGHGRNVVNRFVGVELDALAAGVGEGVDHMSLDRQQTQLKHLKKADRAGADSGG